MVYKGQKGQTKNLFSLWNYGDKCEKRCKTLDWFVCVCIFEKWLNGKPDIIVKLHFRLSCIISNNYLQKTHGTKLITTINNYCVLYRPIYAACGKTIILLSHKQRVILQGSTIMEKHYINYSGIFLVNIQVRWFSPIRREIRLITHYKKASKTHVLEVA